MELLSQIFSWLSDHEAGISAVVGIAVLTGILFAGARSLLRRRIETFRDKSPGAGVAEASAATTPSHPEPDSLTVPGFEGRPAIAILPFDNLSGDPEQEYFADGIVEDLITRLSAWRYLPVIARNSSFTYKGRAVDVKQVSRELGVRYVVDGSVRRSGEQEPAAAELFDDGFLSIDHAGQRASVRGHPLELTPTEMRLLVALATRPGMVLGANQLLEAAWGDSTGTGSDRVKYAVLRLRRKLAEADGDEAAGALETLRGFGYRYQRPMT